MALAGGGYWYLRNLIHTGNPLPWIHHLGPIDLPSPEQALGGREAHSVFSYLTDGTRLVRLVPPGPARRPLDRLAGPRRRGPGGPRSSPSSPRARGRWAESPPDQRGFRPVDVGRMLALAGLVGLAAAPVVARVADLGLGPGRDAARVRIRAPLPDPGADPRPRAAPDRAAAPRLGRAPRLDRPEARRAPGPGGDRRVRRHPLHRGRREEDRLPRRWVVGIVAGAVLVASSSAIRSSGTTSTTAIAIPSFTTPGLDAAFAWARDIDGARIATTSTRQYPLFGTDLSNRVAYLGVHRPHGGFEAAPNCQAFRRLVNEGRLRLCRRHPRPDRSRQARLPAAGRSGSKARTPKSC